MTHLVKTKNKIHQLHDKWAVTHALLISHFFLFFFFFFSLCIWSTYLWLWRHARSTEWDREHYYRVAASRPRPRCSGQVRLTSLLHDLQIQIIQFCWYEICMDIKYINTDDSLCSAPQYISGSCGGGEWAEAEERVGNAGMFSCSHLSWWGSGTWRSTLLHSWNAPQQPGWGHTLYCRGQPHLQWLLEQPTRPQEKLPHLLPGHEQLPRGEWTAPVSFSWRYF